MTAVLLKDLPWFQFYWKETYFETNTIGSHDPRYTLLETALASALLDTFGIEVKVDSYWREVVPEGLNFSLRFFAGAKPIRTNVYLPPGTQTERMHEVFAEAMELPCASPAAFYPLFELALLTS